MKNYVYNGDNVYTDRGEKITSKFFLLFIKSIKHGKIFVSYITKILNNIKSNY